ncbi:MAG: hypothetical protein KGY75_02590 [Candidatus Cloacimonetes bacterium]|nr:hypothetical protein [Candidatus Cloacimonadota bacterium]MBS3766994.1 hypothetical protein [Candidatus Cloacimonadota bacterium]
MAFFIFFQHGQLASNITPKTLRDKKASKTDIVAVLLGTVLVNKKTAQTIRLDIDLFKDLADKIIN